MRALSLALILAVVGCSVPGPEDNKPAPAGKTETSSDPQAAAAASKLLLDKEPAGAKGVQDVRVKAKDGDEVVMVGRIGGIAKPFTPGRAMFLVVDPRLKPNTECECPWDYCDTDDDDLKKSRASVKFVDAQGKTLAASAREAFGIKELSTVVVKGKAVRDKEGNLTVIGSGVYVREK